MTEDEFYELLRLYQHPYDDWYKPASALWDAVRTKQDRLLLTAAHITRYAENFMAVISYFGPDGTLYFLYEKYRKFLNGFKDYRPRFVQLIEAPDAEFVPVAFTESKQKDELDFIRRAFLEETRWKMVLSRLFNERMRLREVHDSVAFKGLKSSTWGILSSYYACADEFADGADIVTIDEYGIETCLAWETYEQMIERRKAHLEDKR